MEFETMHLSEVQHWMSRPVEEVMNSVRKNGVALKGMRPIFDSYTNYQQKKTLTIVLLSSLKIANYFLQYFFNMNIILRIV